MPIGIAVRYTYTRANTARYDLHGVVWRGTGRARLIKLTIVFISTPYSEIGEPRPSYFMSANLPPQPPTYNSAERAEVYALSAYGVKSRPNRHTVASKKTR